MTTYWKLFCTFYFYTRCLLLLYYTPKYLHNQRSLKKEHSLMSCQLSSHKQILVGNKVQKIRPISFCSNFGGIIAGDKAHLNRSKEPYHYTHAQYKQFKHQGNHSKAMYSPQLSTTSMGKATYVTSQYTNMFTKCALNSEGNYNACECQSHSFSHP